MLVQCRFFQVVFGFGGGLIYYTRLKVFSFQRVFGLYSAVTGSVG